jgi:HK97 family phage prohead protease
MDKQFKQFSIDEPTFSERKMSFTISTAAVDRDGDTIDPKGWMLDSYKRNPVVMWAHSYDQLPVAKATRVFLTTTGLHAEIEFPEKGVYPFADTVHDMLKAGFLNATSVGFAPSESVKSKDRQNGYDFTKQELLEFSIVPVPCNPQALVEQRGVTHTQVSVWTKAIKQWADENQPIALNAATKIYKHLTSDTPTYPAFERDYLVETEDGKKAMDEDRLVKLLALHDLAPNVEAKEVEKKEVEVVIPATELKADECCISRDVLDIAEAEIDWSELSKEIEFSIEGKDLDALFLSIVGPTLKEMATAQVTSAMNALTGRVD